jgi:hypothetical protein
MNFKLWKQYTGILPELRYLTVARNDLPVDIVSFIGGFLAGPTDTMRRKIKHLYVEDIYLLGKNYPCNMCPECEQDILEPVESLSHFCMPDMMQLHTGSCTSDFYFRVRHNVADIYEFFPWDTKFMGFINDCLDFIREEYIYRRKNAWWDKDPAQVKHQQLLIKRDLEYKFSLITTILSAVANKLTEWKTMNNVSGEYINAVCKDLYEMYPEQTFDNELPY